MPINRAGCSAGGDYPDKILAIGIISGFIVSIILFLVIIVLNKDVIESGQRTEANHVTVSNQDIESR